MSNTYIWSEFKALSKDKKTYQTIDIALRTGYIDKSNYNRAYGARISIQIVNAKNGVRTKKFILLGEDEIAQILYWINTKEKTISFIHKFNDNVTQIYIDKYQKNDKKYYIIRVNNGKQDSVSYAFSPALFRYLMQKIQFAIALDSYAMNWEIKSRKDNTNMNESLPDNLEGIENEDNFDEEAVPDELPDDIDF